MKKKTKQLILAPFGLLYRLNPVLEQRIMFRLKCGYKLNLKDPQTFIEKVNWLKLCYRDKLYAVCADKYMARAFIEEKGMGRFLPALYWHGERPEDIPFQDLPKSFVIKSTAGSGNNIFVRDKAGIDPKEIIAAANKWLKEKYLVGYGEWHYMDHKPSIVIEEFLSDGVHDVPLDYKLFCFNNIMNGNGRVGCAVVDSARFTAHRRNVYDENFNHLPEVQIGFKRDWSNVAPKPACYDEMCRVATVLAEPFPHVRVDFFVIGDRFYVGELTFFNGAGYDRVTPMDYNMRMGSWIRLPDAKK